MQRINGWHGEVAAFDARTMACITFLEIVVRRPSSLFGVDSVACALHLHLEFNVIEDEELWLWTEERRITKAC